MKLCKFGCGQEAIYQYKDGSWGCSQYSAQCPTIRLKNSNKLKGDCNPSFRPEVKKKISIALIGIKRTIQQKKNASILRKFSIDQLKEKYPTFAKVEEMRYEPGKEDEKEIQVHCKNNKCINSKEQGGWFTPNRYYLFERIRNIEYVSSGGGNFYCCQKCKDECPLYNKRTTELIKQDQINTGYIKEELYTSEEYQTFRQQVLEREDYKCEYCEEKATDVHHSRPQKLEPGFVLDPDFGVACCEKCHYKYGHKDECSTGQLANKVCN